MASTCISNCVDARAPVRATYVNLYKWPESDLAFVRSLSLNERSNAAGNGTASHHGRQQPKVVDSISCRQMYLRSYTFSRDDDDELLNKEMRNRNCLSFRKKKAAAAAENKRKSKPRGGGGGRAGGGGGGGGRRKRKRCTGGFRRAKDISCLALSSVFRRLLSCTTKVDVVG
ncbi:OLC1v1004145C1 [Oldenlandia corymbosa var. corymbosa]|uniref:OLC1v1004145C1 n=1 Tax=Oldenlandia corymbosa var. corymbosa TaxID=529605 RepID=A0AAV1DDH5_OLDCO|nr:OLC1v1004145C1 [Oldenlandia corymbosa var. corymbosa]